MAFIRRPNQQQSSMYSEGGTGMLGTTQQQSGAMPTASKAQASPSSWYNVQDFLGANKEAAPRYQQSIQEKADKLIGEDTTKAQENVSAIKSIERPEAQGFDKDKAWTGDQSYLSGALQQNYTPEDYTQFDMQANQNIMGLQPGSRESILRFNKSVNPNQRQNYTSGMQRMDDLILGQDPNFVESFGGTVKDQYQGNVIDPLTTAFNEAEAQDAETQQRLEEARTGWTTGLSNLLGEKQAGIDTTLKQMAAEAARIRGTDPATELQRLIRTGGFDLAGGSNRYTGKNYGSIYDWIPENVSGLASIQGYDPTRENAAMQSLGETGINQFNLIESLLGGEDTYEQIRGEEYTPLSWSYKPEEAVSRFNTQAGTQELDDLTSWLADQRSSVDASKKQERQLKSQAEELWDKIQRDTIGRQGGGTAINPDVVDYTTHPDYMTYLDLQRNLGLAGKNTSQLENKLSGATKRELQLKKLLGM